MSSDDIANLYRQFGGLPENYQELGRDNVVRQSRERWPMLANVRLPDTARPARPASVRLDAGDARVEPQLSDGPLPTVFDEQAADAAALAAAAPAVPATPGTPAALPPFARPAPAAGTFVPPPAPAAAAHVAPQVAPANELQGIFSRLARAPEPPTRPADPDVSLLRRLLRP